MGFTQAVYWIRLELVNSSTQPKNDVAEIDYTLLDGVTFYSLSDSLQQASLLTGDTLPIYQRDINNPSQLLGLQL